MRQELKEQLLKGVVTIILCTSVFLPQGRRLCWSMKERRRRRSSFAWS